jgi:uncharacterized protein involved in exopolysaccharide biosynthesis
MQPSDLIVFPHLPPHPMTDQQIDQDYEISILDILVVLAENIKIIILVPVVVGVITLNLAFGAQLTLKKYII